MCSTMTAILLLLYLTHTHRLVYDLHQASTLHHQCYVARAILLASKDKLLREERNKCLLCTAKVSCPSYQFICLFVIYMYIRMYIYMSVLYVFYAVGHTWLQFLQRSLNTFTQVGYCG